MNHYRIIEVEGKGQGEGEGEWKSGAAGSTFLFVQE